jgi:hypothetical protein
MSRQFWGRPEGALAVVLATVLVASFVPAWRASRIDPIVALRHRRHRRRSRDSCKMLAYGREFWG